VNLEGGDQRTVLSILAYLSNCHSERVEVLEAILKVPMAVVRPALEGLKASEYVVITTEKSKRNRGDIVEITQAGQAYFLERVTHLKNLIALMSDGPGDL